MSIADLREQASKKGDYESLIGDQLSLDQSVPYIGQGWDEYFDTLNNPDRHWSERFRDVSWLTPEQLDEAIQHYDSEEARLKGIMDPYVDDWNNLRSGTQEYADWAKNQYNTEFDKRVDRFNEADYTHYDRDDGSYSDRQDFDITPEMIERWRSGEDIFADYRGEDRSMQMLDSMSPNSAFYVDPDNFTARDERRNPFSMERPDDYISNMINQYRTTGEHGVNNAKYNQDWQDLQEDWQSQFNPQYNAMVQSQADYDKVKDRSSQLRALKEQSDRFYDSGLDENYDSWKALLTGGRDAGIHSLFPDNELFLWDGRAPGVDPSGHSPEQTSLGKSVKDMLAMGLNPGLMMPSLMSLRDPWGRNMFVDGQYQNHPDIPATEDMRKYWDEYNPEGRYAPDLPEFIRADFSDSTPTAQSAQDERAAQAQTIWDMINENGAVEAEEGDPNDVNGDGWITPVDALTLANPEESEDPQNTSVWTPDNIVGPPETAYGAIGNDPGNPEGIQAQDVGAFGVDSTTGVPFVFTRNVGAGPDATKAYANPEESVRWLLGAGDSTKDWHQGVVSGFVDPSTLTQQEYDFANDWWNQQIENNPSYAEGYGYLPSFESLADFEVGPTQSDPVDYIKQGNYNWERNFPEQDWAPHEDWANDPNRTWYVNNPITGEYLQPDEQKYYSGYYGYGHQTGDGWVTGQALPENLTALDVGVDFPEFQRPLHTDASVTEDLIRNYNGQPIEGYDDTTTDDIPAQFFDADEGNFDSSGNLNTSSTSTGTVDEDEGLFDSEGNLNTSSNLSGNTSTHSELEEVIDLNKDDPDFIWDRDNNQDGIVSPVDRLEDIAAADQNAGGNTGGGTVDPGDGSVGGDEGNRFGMKDEDIVAGLGREDTSDLFHPYGSKEYNEKQGKSAFHKAFGLHRNTPTQNYITE